LPSFTIEAADLWNEGPVIEVTLSPSGAALAAMGLTGSGPVASASILVDTGASHSLVKNGVLGPLGLHPVGATEINTPSSQRVACALYSVRMTFPHGQYLDTTVIEGPAGGLDGQNIEGLLGRDVLRHGLFIYLGGMSQFTLGF
jgi:hypothetical protein